MTRHIFVVRHGATRDNGGQKYIGHLDVALGEKGVIQAKRLRQALKAWPIGAAFCSDLARCRQTAEIAMEARGVEIVARRDLREASIGEWEGHLRSEIAASFPEECAARSRDFENHRVCGGETFKECAARVLPAFEEILRNCPNNILMVGHGSTNRLLLCHLLGMPTSNLFRLGQDHGCLNIIKQDETEHRVMLLNFTP